MIEGKSQAKVIQDHIHKLEELRKLTRELSRAKDLRGITEIFTSCVQGILSADACYFTLKDRSHTEGSHVIYVPCEGERSMDRSFLGHAETVRKILSAGGIVQIDDAQQTDVLDSEVVGMLGIRSALAFQLVVGKVEMGIGVVIFRSHHTFSREEILICEQAVHALTFALDQFRTQQDKKRRQAVYEALGKANVRLTSSLELETILESILHQALTLVGADDVHIFLYDEEQLSFAGAQWANDPVSEPYSMPRETGITYSVARSGERIVTPSVDEDPLFKSWQWGGAIVSLPLGMGEQVIGVMNVAFERPHDFIEEELWVLDMLATQAAFALQNANLFQQLKLDRERIQVLFDVTSALVTELGEDRILQLSIDLITKHFDAALGEAFRYEQSTGRLCLKAISGATDLSVDELDAALDLFEGKGIEGWVAEHNESLAVADVKQDDRWQGVDGIHDGIQSNLCAPIILGENLLGVLSILYEGKAEPDHLDLLNAVSQQVGLALSNAKKYRQIERRVAELSALQRVANAINRRLDREQLLQEVVDQVHQVLGYEIVAVYLIDEKHLHLHEAVGVEDYLLDQIPLTEGIIGRVARTNEVVFAPDVSKEPDYLAALPATRSEIAVPIRKGDAAIGVLNVESSSRDGLDEDDQRLLMLLADQVSVAIENAALYGHVRDQAENLERMVKARTAELESALDDARVAERMKSQFVADVSHELRTPLTNMRLYIDLLNFGNQERFSDYLDILTRETDRLVILIEDLLAISRLDSGRTNPDPGPMNLNSLVSSLIEDRQRLLSEKSLGVHLALMEDLPVVMADENMVSQAIANLMTNAMHYTKPGGTIKIKTKREIDGGQEWVTVAISDTGVGIRPDERERVFERFYRGTASKLMPVPGTGLGLAICKELIDRHRGRITLQSEVDEGSEFTIWLPILGDS